jgi:glycerol uptake operon antiterminator
MGLYDVLKKGESMQQYPIIASIVREDQLESAEHSSVEQVILMTGNILNLKEIVERLHRRGKKVYVHIEQVAGIGRDAAAIHYIGQTFRADGIVSTKSNMIVAARQAGLQTIQRIFAIDTGALETAIRMIGNCQPDKVELMPGLMPRVIREIRQRISQPLIVGGLIRHEEEIRSAFRFGADYVSVGNEQFWPPASR